MTPLRTIATLLLTGAFLLDAIGRAAGETELWTLGAQANTLGLLCGVLVWCIAWFGARGGQISWFFALAAFALARFLRGSAGVPPDLPLIALAGLGTLLLALSWWLQRRARRARSQRQSRADAAPPA